MPRSRSTLRLLTLAAVLIAPAQLVGCASLRQNIRGQELSYRGAWHCPSDTCTADDMVRSTRGTRDGTVNISTVKLDPKAGMAFTAAAPFDSLSAVAIDCKGTRAELPSAVIQAPGKHAVKDGDARESWIVWIAPADTATLERGKDNCAIWKIEASATWADGATHSLTAGIQIED